VGALGVVFGDIGTSPLYPMKECMAHLPAGVDPFGSASPAERRSEIFPPTEPTFHPNA